MNAPELATLSTTGDCIRLTMRRAPLNFMNVEMLRQMQHLLESLGDSPKGRILVIDSEGPAFSAGLEMSELTLEPVFLLIDHYHAVINIISSFPRPTVALVHGVALGAGNELAACCDFVLASHTSTFGQPEIKVGIMPTLAPLILPLRIGIQRTMQMILTGAPVDAQEAERIGLVLRSVPESALENVLQELMGSLIGCSAPVMEMVLRASRTARNRELENNLREIRTIYLEELMDLEDPIEGVKAFMEKRAPRWSR
jgi:cyclohexa-1,5-dienecarbonyl-CoA hydratase